MSPHPLVDQDSKQELIMAKQIRQSTCKILQRPSQFQGYENKNKQSQMNSKIKERLEYALGHKQQATFHRKPKQTEEVENKFENTFQSNFKENKRLTDYENQFEALHHEVEYEYAENKTKPMATKSFGPVSLDKVTHKYLEPTHSTKTFSYSSNSARDTLAKKSQGDNICLGKEPDVTPAQNMKLIKRFTNTIDRKMKQMTPAMPDLEIVRPPSEISQYNIQEKIKKKESVSHRVRKCPDPNLYEDILESNENYKSNSMHLHENITKKFATSAQSSSPEPNPDIRTPFQNLQNSLFSMFTAIVPWCMMKKVYWKRDKRSEELYERTSRLNAKNKKISEERKTS